MSRMRLSTRHIVGLVAAIVLGGALVLTLVNGIPTETDRAAIPQDTASHPTHVKTSPAPPAPLRQGERFISLALPRPFTPEPDLESTDVYRCFLLDPKLTEASFVTGSQFLPDNADVVHHAIVFRVMPDELTEARSLDAASPGDGWSCFGGTGLASTVGARQLSSGSAWIAAWAPGGRESLLDRRVGYEMPAGGHVILQMHYNLLGDAAEASATDQSGVRLRIAPGSARLAPLRTTLVPAPIELPCTAAESGPLCDRETATLDVWRRFGAQSARVVAGLNLLCNAGRPPVPGPTQHCDITIQSAGTIYAAAGHMHLLGRSITIELNPGTPKAKTLLDVPAYDFDNQGARVLDNPVAVKPGDTYRVTCTHDASLRSRLPALSDLPARYVVWGEGTSDEMCLGIVIWSAKAWA